MKSVRELQLIANRNRMRIVDMLNASRSGHPGGSLSAIDIITAIYENAVDFSSADRAKVVLSKGHAIVATYAELAEKGILAEEQLSTLRRFGSPLQGHPSVVRIPEVDASTGLLGQGLSIGTGMALAKRFKNDPNNVFVICGDGEFTEGQNYEALSQAAFYKLNKLALFLDSNQLCLNGKISEIMDLGDLEQKIKAFGWKTFCIDGHDMKQLSDAVEYCKTNQDLPVAFICRTIKGKGISYMENVPAWHGGVMTEEQYELAKKELLQHEEAING